ncbi:guanine nucleotide-binding protein subunit gamma 3 isoform X2 [Neltuma alba]|uniref:guanine nucleotide-binding protein subunit gamma 3 isoform X2 n=1 Tax=Neltuma alba TaxID=207710 RepID=UPI0010A2A991|nr:guanine nucleotide-binding protein subunit gamma 3-like isoform X2 [Prosopis alba]
MSFTSMATSLTSSTEQPLSPRSPPPPGLLDFYGKRKQMVKIQVLEREIALLQEELKSLEGLHPASRCCKEVWFRSLHIHKSDNLQIPWFLEAYQVKAVGSCESSMGLLQQMLPSSSENVKRLL